MQINKYGIYLHVSTEKERFAVRPRPWQIILKKGGEMWMDFME